MLLPVLWFVLEPLPAAFILSDSDLRTSFLCVSSATSILLSLKHCLYMLGFLKTRVLCVLALKSISVIVFSLMTAVKIYLIPRSSGLPLLLFGNSALFLTFLYLTEAISAWMLIRVKLKQMRAFPNNPEKKESSLIVDIKRNSMRTGIAS